MIVDTVDREVQALDRGPPAGATLALVDNGTGAIFLQGAVDLPDQLLTRLLILRLGLLVEQLLQVLVAV